jgi:hypothetical protein
MAQQGMEPAKLIPALERFDDAVAAQAADLVAAAGGDPRSPAFEQALQHASSTVQNGFRHGSER